MHQKTVPLLASTLTLLLLGASCTGSSRAEVAGLRIQPSDSEAVRYAKTKWQTLCSTCHGPTGRGDGPAGRALNPRPRSFHEADWQASVDDDHIRRIILDGGQAVGKSALMPGNPDLQDKPEAVEFLVEIVRSFGK